MGNKSVSLLFVTRSFYEDVVNSGGSLNDVIYPTIEKVSPLSKAIHSKVDGEIHRVLFNDPFNDPVIVSTRSYSKIPEEVVLKLGNEEIQYAKDFTNSYLNLTDGMREVGKCYEVIPQPYQDEMIILVIVEEGFLSYVTETKEVLLEFLLTVLGHGYGKTSNYHYSSLKTYLGLKLSEANFNLIKNRLDRH